MSDSAVTPPRVPSTLRVFCFSLLLISVPFWVLGPLADALLPADFPINLPFSALMALNPMLVALALVYREQGGAGVKMLLKRVLDFRRIRDSRWYLPAFLLMPLLTVIEYGVVYLRGSPMDNVQVPLLAALPMFIVFFITAVGEELGWMGYVYEPLRQRWNSFETGVLLGGMWALWHLVAYLQMGNSLSWVFWQCAATVGLRVLIVWLYEASGKSMFATIIFHATINVGNFMFPNYGSYYDPFAAAVVIGAAVMLVLLVWKPVMLRRARMT